MTDNEIKEECLTESGIDLGRYSHTELTQIKDALIRYHNVKLKLLGIPVVVGMLCEHNWHHLDNHSDRMICLKCDKRI
jgi:hypothetical protein